MIEIYIPTKIKGYGQINTISNNFKKIIKNDLKLDIKESNSIFFEGFLIKNHSKLRGIKTSVNYIDLIILLNGEIGKNYFIDYDFLNIKIDSLGTKIVGKNEIGNNIENIFNNITSIITDLKSNKLLTNTKKQNIKEKIENSLFALSGITFLLYELKNKSKENISDLQNKNLSIEYQAQASLLSETSKTKKIELQAMIDKVEGQIELFIGAIGKMI